jgi:tight adherence protein C
MNRAQQVYLALVFVTAMAGALGLAMLAVRGQSIRGRLRRLVDRGDASQPHAWAELMQAARRVAEALARWAQPSADVEYSRLRARLDQAGWRGRAAPVLFFAFKTLGFLMGPALVWLVLRGGGLALPSLWALGVMVGAAALGYAAPNLLMAWATRRRQRLLFEAFPDAIDLMVVCVEAGLGLDMAINRSAREIRLRSPELADELDRVVLELRVGAARERALRNLALRTGLADMASFATMLIQADRFGTSLSDSLRVHAASLRTRRQLRAEEAAAKIPLKLLFPLIFFIFPSMMVVLLGPAMIQIYRTLLPTLSGQS